MNERHRRRELQGLLLPLFSSSKQIDLEVEDSQLNKIRQRVLLENLELFHQTNDAFFVLPGSHDATGNSQLEVLRVVTSDSATQRVPVH